MRKVPPSGVRNVKGGGAGFDDLSENAVQKFGFGATRVFGTELDVIATKGSGAGKGSGGELG